MILTKSETCCWLSCDMFYPLQRIASEWKEMAPYVSIRSNNISHAVFFVCFLKRKRNGPICQHQKEYYFPYSFFLCVCDFWKKYHSEYSLFSVDINIYWGFEMFLIYWLLAHVFGDKIIFWIFSLSALILRLFLFNQYNGFGEKMIFWIICSSISVYIEVSQGGYLLLFLAMNVFNFLDDIKQLYNRSLWIFCPSALTLRCHRACLSICQRLRTKPPVYNWTVKVVTKVK